MKSRLPLLFKIRPNHASGQDRVTDQIYTTFKNRENKVTVFRY